LIITPFIDETVDHLSLPSSSEDHTTDMQDRYIEKTKFDKNKE
jgi:hypothetical protein